jgi:twitching motility protein PilT
MVARGASDLHITAGERPKLRVDGEITNASHEQSLGPRDTMALAYSVLTDNQKKRFEMEDELDFSFGIQNLARFRGNAFKQRGCVSLAVRQIPFAIKPLQDLGLPWPVASFADKPRGLVLVTGPTGSGKSTTLAALIDKINSERRGTSSRSRTRSSSCTATRTASSTSARSGRHQVVQRRAQVRAARGSRTSSSWARCATWRRSRPR